MEADYVFTLDEEFNETIKSRGREDFSYASFSQGEKARIDIALLFTWRDIAEKVSGATLVH
ncbi:recombination endonuclease subunit [Escherichia phage Bp7]|uniref:Recombination endonuclease subunit n=1 Tax=Escherichia phage Bp7 TaxID=1052121 RepID=G3MUV9_9CAUD|nr:recombination endonuclease subunit [Escherichia phage Bp7]AEN93794.1 recombination endonuclease subunit [Escherichia phage Bp7]